MGVELKNTTKNSGSWVMAYKDIKIEYFHGIKLFLINIITLCHGQGHITKNTFLISRFRCHNS